MLIGIVVFGYVVPGLTPALRVTLVSLCAGAAVASYLLWRFLAVRRARV